MNKSSLVRATGLMVLLAVSGSVAVSGQVRTGWVSAASAVGDEVIDTGDSPVGVLRKASGMDFRDGVYSKSDKPIRAYVAAVTERGETRLKFELHEGPRILTDAQPSSFVIFRGDVAPVWSFDWVLFADGTTWGADRYGRSSDVRAVMRGVEGAYTKAIELGLLKERPSMSRSWGSGVEAAVSKANSDKENFDSGFESVVSMISSDRRTKTDDAFRQAFETLRDWQANAFGK